MGAYAYIPGTKDFRNRLKTHATKVYTSRSLAKITHLVIHHSLTKTGSAEAFARYHVNNNGWPGIGYHFVIEKDGTVKWCHDLEIKSYHVGKHNIYCLGICLTGDFRSQVLEEIQLNPLIDLIKYLKQELGIPIENIVGHSEFPDYSWKECPCIDMDVLRSKLKSKTSPPQFITPAQQGPNQTGPFQHPLDLSYWLNPNHLHTHPGENILQAAHRLNQQDLGAVKQRNKTVALATKKTEPQVVKTVGSVEILPEKVKHLVELMKQKGHQVFTNDQKPYNLNIVGIRSRSMEVNTFNDEICVFWKYENRWTIKTYQATTDPGLTFLKDPINDDGTAILKAGQYIKAYKLGLHRQKYQALIQARPVTVIRDFDRDGELDYDSGREQTGYFGINIHHASYTGRSTYVNKWSAGCQVIADIKDFNEFIKLCKLGISNWSDELTYTLLEA